MSKSAFQSPRISSPGFSYLSWPAQLVLLLGMSAVASVGALWLNLLISGNKPKEFEFPTGRPLVWKIPSALLYPGSCISGMDVDGTEDRV